MENKKSMLKKIWIICLIFIIIQILIEKFFQLKLLIMAIPANSINLILILILLLLPNCFLNNDKHNLIKKLYKVISIILVVPILLVYILILSIDKNFYFTSPYELNKRVLIVEETDFSMGVKSSFYERKYGIFIKPIGEDIITDKRPFSSNTATIKWIDENSVQLDHIYNSNDTSKTYIIKFN